MADNKAEIVVDGNIAPLKQKLREAGDELKRFGATGGPAVDGVASSVMKLTSRFTALGAVVTLGGLVTMARQAIDAADSLNDLADRTQTSVKALASFQLIAKLSDTDLNALGKGLNRLTIFMAENAAEAKKLGITAREPVEAFIQFADALGRAATPQDRAAIANRVLGKSFQDLLPLLSRGADQLREAAAASAEYADRLADLAPRAGEVNDRLDEMRVRWDALKVSMASVLLDLLPNAWTMDASAARIIELRGEIGSLERALKGSDGSGLLHRWLYGTKDEIAAKLAAARKELAALQAAPVSGASRKGALTFADIAPKASPKAAAKPAGKQVSDSEWAMEEEAHLRRTLYEIDQQRNEYHEAANRALLESDKRLIREMDQIHLLRIEGAKNAELARIDEMEAIARHELDMGSITQSEYLARLAEFNEERLAAEADLIEKKIQLAKQDPTQDPVEIERMEQELAGLRRQYGLKRLEIEQQQAQESQGIWSDLSDRVTGLWDKGVQALLNGTLTWKNAMQAIGAEVVQWFATKVVGETVKNWIAGLAQRLAALVGFNTAEKGIEAASAAATVATKTAETTAVVGANAAQAGSGAAASQASIPIVGPVLALAAMAAVFAAVSALGNRKSAARGYDIPKGINPMVQTHEEEMILPAPLANAVRRMAGEGEEGQGERAGGDTINVSINATDAAGVRRLFMDNQGALVAALKNAHRNAIR